MKHFQRSLLGSLFGVSIAWLVGLSHQQVERGEKPASKSSASAQAASATASSSASTTTTTTTTSDTTAVGEVEKCYKKEWDVVLVTDDRYFWQGAKEEKPVIRELKKLGRKATRVSIQDLDFEWNTTKVVVIRSAWDKYGYYDDYVAFLDEMDAMPTVSLFNPRALIGWHAAKSVYINDLNNAGIPIPETYWVMKEEKEVPDLYDISEELGCEEMVMKPAAGNAGAGVEHIKPKNMYKQQGNLFYLLRGYSEDEDDSEDDDEEFVPGEEADDVMIQCFQHNIRTEGERGVIFVGGEVTHAVLKKPNPDGGFLVHEGYGGSTEVIDPSPEEVEFAKKTAKAVEEIVGQPPLYLRVDIITDNDGNLALMELAAGTASLWIKQRPEAAEVLARALDKYLTEQEKTPDPRICDPTTYDDDDDDEHRTKPEENTCTVGKVVASISQSLPNMWGQ